jgi:broad specificity phosphatase PhoE
MLLLLPTLVFSMQLTLFTITMILQRAAAFQELFIVRHGQATHNPRAEAAKQAGCSFEEFLEWMRLDDSHDSPLTELGREQGANVGNQYQHLLSGVEMVISSPLSRCLDTANLVAPPTTLTSAKRVVYENFREINGKLLNAKRRNKSELEKLYPEWSFDNLQSNHDDSWVATELESVESCQQRGLAGFQWLTTLPMQSLLLVCHGGILHYTLAHDNIVLHDNRQCTTTDRKVDARFENCEIRRYQLSIVEEENKLMLTEVDLVPVKNEKRVVSQSRI